MKKPAVDPTFTFGVSLVVSLIVWYPSLRLAMSGDLDITDAGIRYFLALALVLGGRALHLRGRRDVRERPAPPGAATRGNRATPAPARRRARQRRLRGERRLARPMVDHRHVMSVNDQWSPNGEVRPRRRAALRAAFCRRRTRRWRSTRVRPPQTPSGAGLASSANSRHSSRTGQIAQIAFAVAASASAVGKNTSVSASVQAASSNQSVREGTSCGRAIARGSTILPCPAFPETPGRTTHWSPAPVGDGVAPVTLGMSAPLFCDVGPGWTVGEAVEDHDRLRDLGEAFGLMKNRRRVRLLLDSYVRVPG